MQIVEVVPNLGLGGVETVVAELSKELVRRGHSVEMASLFADKEPSIASKRAEELARAGVGISLLGCRFRDFVTAGMALARIIRRRRPDVLHVHLRYPAMAGTLASWLKRPPVVVETYHSHYRCYRSLTWFTRTVVDWYVGVSESATQELVTRFGLPSVRCATIRNGIDVGGLRREYSEPRSSGTRDAGRVEFRPVRLVTAGRLSAEKGIDVLLDALTGIAPSVAKALHVTIIGSGPMEAELRAKARYSVVPVEFRRALPRSEFLALLADYDVAVLPSRFEGLSILAIELLALGKPVVASDIPSFRETFGFRPLRGGDPFQEFDCGLVVRPNDPRSLGMALAELTRRVEKLGDWAYRSYERAEEFRIHNVARDYEALFQQALNRKRQVER